MFELRAKNPPVAIEIGEGYAAAVRMQGKGAEAALQDYRIVPLPFRRREGDSLWADFKLDERFQEGIDELIGWLDRPRRLAVSLPDTATKVFFLEIENDGGSPRELRNVILFKIQKFAPISSENTSLAFRKLKPRAGGGGHYLAVISSRSLTGSYERYLSQSGTHVGNIETASLAAISLLGPKIASEDHHGNFVLVRMENLHFTASAFNGGKLVFSRTRIAQEPERMAATAAHELRVLSLFTEDQLRGSAFATAYFYGPGGRIDEAVEATRAMGWQAEMLDLGGIIDVPGELLQRPSDAGKLVVAAALAARG